MQRYDLGLNLNTKRMRKREFLAQPERVVPCAALEALIEPHWHKRKTGRPPIALQTKARVLGSC